MMFFKSNSLRAAAIAAAIIPTTAQAVVAGDPTVLPGSTQVGQPALGSDMWTQAMTQLGLFRVHRDDCDSGTEAFVEVYTDDNSVQFGFCIDKNEHSAGAVHWEDARQECLDDGKRLPETGEWKFACDIAGSLSLSNMTDDWEWTSNFWQLERKSGSNSWRSIDAPVFGDGNCETADHGNIGRSDTRSASFAFRCVR